MDQKGKKLAVLVGCNYPNTSNELHGCHNDVLVMRDVLIIRFRFDPNNIVLLTDKPGSLIMPTGSNIMKALNRMVSEAEVGDVLYFHYSGHGTLLNKPFLPFVKEEAIVPTDFNLITSPHGPCGSELATSLQNCLSPPYVVMWPIQDHMIQWTWSMTELSLKKYNALKAVAELREDVDLRNVVNRVPKGATFTILSDSCHSGGLIDKEKEQIGHSNGLLDGDGNSDDSLACTTKKSKAIPFESIVDHLSSLTNINTADIGTHLLEIFGPDASLRFQLPQVEIDLRKPLKADQGILLSGCQTDETSADVGDGEKAFGAFSNGVQQVLKQHSGPLTNRDVVIMARKNLAAQKFEQHPVSIAVMKMQMQFSSANLQLKTFEKSLSVGINVNLLYY